MKVFILFCLLMIPSLVIAPVLTDDVVNEINRFVKQERSELISHIWGDYKEEIVTVVIKHVPYEESLLGKINMRKLLIVMANKESAGNPKAVSKRGAIGVWQIMPYEAEYYGYTAEDMFSIEKNLLVAKKVLYRKANLVKNAWTAVQCYNGSGWYAHNYKNHVKRAYYKLNI